MILAKQILIAPIVVAGLVLYAVVCGVCYLMRSDNDGAN